MLEYLYSSNRSRENVLTLNVDTALYLLRHCIFSIIVIVISLKNINNESIKRVRPRYVYVYKIVHRTMD